VAEIIAPLWFGLDLLEAVSFCKSTTSVLLSDAKLFEATKIVLSSAEKVLVVSEGDDEKEWIPRSQL